MDQGSDRGEQADEHAPSVCYRHPDTEARVRCTRCGRPICPSCMVDAAVGFQCPECVREGTRGTRPARTEFGGRVPSGRPSALARQDAPVTKALIGLCVVVWGLELLLGSGFVDRFAMLGAAVVPGQGFQGVAVDPWQSYRLLTSVFLHQSPFPLHIAMNMLSLWWIGPPLERMLGRLRYLVVFLVSGLAGSALCLLLAAPYQESLGASGAIFGLLGALVVLFRRRGYVLGPLVALIVFNLILTFSIRAIAWQAHIGGLVAGVLVALGMAYAPRRHRAQVQAAVVVAVLLLIGLGTWLGITRIMG